MKKLMCLLVVFFISNAANAADKWEYVQFKSLRNVAKNHTSFILYYPDGRTDIWENRQGVKSTKPPKIFQSFAHRFGLPIIPLHMLLSKDFSQQINVVNILGQFGFEMSSNTRTETEHYLRQSFWFKKKVSK